MKKSVLMFSLLLVTIACSPIENKARDTAAALQGAILAAQSQYQTPCTADPTQAACKVINKAVSGQNALITSIEAYCGWSTTNPPSDPSAKCSAVKAAQPALETSIANATEFITELKGVLK
jgi:hypothetical protein